MEGKEIAAEGMVATIWPAVAGRTIVSREHDDGVVDHAKLIEGSSSSPASPSISIIPSA
jgi:hypothetical protein